MKPFWDGVGGFLEEAGEICEGDQVNSGPAAITCEIRPFGTRLTVKMRKVATVQRRQADIEPGDTIQWCRTSAGGKGGIGTSVVGEPGRNCYQLPQIVDHWEALNVVQNR